MTRTSRRVAHPFASFLAFATAFVMALSPAGGFAQGVDPVARGLAAKANTPAGIAAAGGALVNRQRLLTGIRPTGLLRPVMAAPITITTSASAPGGSYTKQWPSDQTATANWLPVADFYGGFLTRATNRVKPRVATSNPVTATDPAGATGFDDTSSAMSFWTDDPAPVLMVNTSNTTPFRFKVRSASTGIWEYVSLTGTVAAATGDSYITLDLSTVALPAQIMVEGANSWAIQRILTLPTHSVWAPKDRSARIMVIGDSYPAGPVSSQYSSPSPINQDGWPRLMGNLLNTPDVWPSALGGTGWVTASGTKPAFKDRAYDALNLMPDGVTYRSAWRPDLIIATGGLNDVSAGASTASVQAAIQLFYDYIRARNTTVPILFTGVHWRPAGNLANTQAMEVAIAAQVATIAARDPLVGYLPITAIPWDSGTGYQGATNGTGNTDFNTGTDAVHPSYAGHAEKARRYGVGVLDFARNLND